MIDLFDQLNTFDIRKIIIISFHIDVVIYFINHMHVMLLKDALTEQDISF